MFGKIFTEQLFDRTCSALSVQYFVQFTDLLFEYISTLSRKLQVEYTIKYTCCIE